MNIFLYTINMNLRYYITQIYTCIWKLMPYINKKWQRRNTRIIHVQVIKLLYFIWYLYNTGTLNFRNFNTDLRTI